MSTTQNWKRLVAIMIVLMLFVSCLFATNVHADTNKSTQKMTTSKNSLLLNSALKLTQKGSKLHLKFGKVSDATSYEVSVSYYGQKKAQVFKTTKNSLIVKKLNNKKLNTKKVFKVLVVAKAGKKIVGQSITAYVAGTDSKYTNAKTVKVAKSLNLNIGKTSIINATAIPANAKRKLLAYEGKFRYASSDTNVATVNKSGKVTAKHQGTCYIYVFSNNGFSAKVKVTVTVPFNAKAEKEKEQTDTANVRAACEEVIAAYLKDGKPHFKTVPATQEKALWQDENCGRITTQINGEEKIYSFAAKTKGTSYTVKVKPNDWGLMLTID